MDCQDSYAYRFELYGSAGEPLGQAAVAMQWDSAVEGAHFLAIRQKRLPANAGPLMAAVLPRWSPRLGEPYVEGYRVELAAEGHVPIGQDFGTAYFEPLAAEASEQLVSRGTLRAGDEFRWVVTAYPREQQAGSRGSSVASNGCVPTPLRLGKGSLADHLARAEAEGDIHAADLPVFVPRHVLDELSRLARQAGARETGGVLIGDLHGDDSVPEVFGVVSAQVPASQARGELARLTFTPDAWAEIDRVMRLRGGREVMLGWWHTHPAYAWECKRCPVARRRRCPLASAFLSEQDRALHRTVFPRAFSLALVVNLITGAEHTYSMFGWRDGLLVPRGFFRLGSAVAG